mmetsp:Transcript_48061/g.78343  ORF Transcript_48061/g.78343 Transcript_48061/m.78343 type:complete len:476 (+) Transcript_48061:2-1429(+)
MHREKAHDLVEYKTYKEPSNDALVANVPKLRVAFRFCQLTILFLPFVTLWFICSRNETLYIWWCKMFKRMLEITGPTFVKAGQWAAMRSDIFSKEFCDILSDLHANVSPHPLRHTVKLIKENLGADIDELFSEFNPTPIGSGSIAQVYFAKLKSSGEQVAVKVCHPHVRERIALDFYCIQMVAHMVHGLAPWMDYPGIANQFACNLSLQVDLRFEAQNLDSFRNNFQESEYVIFPKPIMASEQVLVEEKITGKPLTEWYGGNGEESPAHRRLAEAGSDVFLQMILTDNFFHADIHPGNCLVGYRKGEDVPYLAMLDVGVCQTLTKEQRDVSHELLTSIIIEDWERVALVLLKMSPSQDFCNQADFRQEIRDICNRLMPPFEPKSLPDRLWLVASKLGLTPRTTKKTGMCTDFVQSIFNAMQEHRVRIDPAYASLLFSCLMMECIANHCDSTLDVITHAAPWFLSSAINGPRRLAH